MKIIDIRVLRGPNYWSNFRKKLIVMKLDLEELENFPTDKIPGFPERLQKMFPTMISHRCSRNREGGFFERVNEGTYMGHVIEHIALEIQTLAGMDCGFGRTRSTGEQGIYNIIFTYEIEEAGLYAAEAAVHIAEKLISGEAYDLEKDLERLRRIKIRKSFGPS